MILAFMRITYKLQPLSKTAKLQWWWSVKVQIFQERKLKISQSCLFALVDGLRVRIKKDIKLLFYN